jgi:iron complex outermembrane receptor protein
MGLEPNENNQEFSRTHLKGSLMKMKLTSLGRFTSMLAAFFMALTSFSAGQVFAEETVIEEVVVTGSRIARSNFEAASPIDVVTAEDLEASGVISVDEYLKRLPTFSGWQAGANINNGGDGGKFVDVRGLGFKRTLILVNGRRTVGSFIGSSSDVGAVDLNTIPIPMIERIEVLKDGASAIYGSDALAGVINIITKDRFEGIEISADASWGTEEWDAKTHSFSTLLGAANDRGGAQMSLTYAKQGELLQGEREWAEDALWPQQQADGSFVSEPGGSSNSRQIDTDGFFDPSAAAIADGASFIVDEQSGLARPFTSDDVYNYAPVNALITPHERYQIAAQADYEFSDEVAIFGEASYTRRNSAQRLAPDASFSVQDYNGLPNEFVPASNVFNPFGDCGLGGPGCPNGTTALNDLGISGQDVGVNRRFTESGGRRFTQSVDSFRMLGGLRGAIADSVEWELSYIYSEGEVVNETNFYHRFDRWAIMVDPDQCAADPGCVDATGPQNVLNPFQPFGGITQDELGFLMASSLKDQYKNNMQNLNLSFNGAFGELEGGAIGWSAGYEWRKEGATFVPDEFLGSGLTTGGASDPLSGSFKVDELYGEMLFPLLAGRSFAESLEVEAAIRYSDYNTAAGSTTNGKLGVNWAITNSWRVRTSYSTGFRAPNVVEQVAGQSTAFPIVENPCEYYGLRSDATDNIQANCAAEGLPDDFGLGFQWQAAYFLNPDPEMKPEESTTWTFGLVWTPENIEGLRLSLDWWQYEIDEYIDAPDYNGVLRNCLDAEDQDANAAAGGACSIFLNGTSGLNFGGAVGDDAETEFGNLGKVETAGLDWAADYTRPVEWGFINLMEIRFFGTYLDKYRETFPLSGTQELVGTAGDDDGFGVYPEWRWNTMFTLSSNNASLGWNMYWIDETDDLLRPAEITDAPKADSVLYHDLVGSYTWRQAIFSMGLENLTNEKPPRFHSAFNANTAPGVYDVVGRKLWLRVKVAF